MRQNTVPLELNPDVCGRATTEQHCKLRCVNGRRTPDCSHP